MNDLVSKISEKEQDVIREYIANYASDSGKIYPERPLSHILRFWNDKKASLYKKFGNKFIISKEVVVEMPKREIERKMDDLLRNHPFIRECNDRWYLQGLNTKTSLNYSVSLNAMFFYPSAFINNTYTGRTFDVTIGEKKIRVQEGSSVIRTIHKISRLLGVPESLFEDFRIKHSTCLNQKKLKGELCLSIHPLDFMTSSDNDYNWSSCMSWQGRGEYRQGTVEMMNSPYVVVAYLKGKEDFFIGDYPWSNKKWREYFIVSDEIISGVKGYPYQSKDLSAITLEWLKELCGADNYEDTINEYDGYHLDGQETSVHFNTDIMYNDFGTTTHYCILSKDHPYYIELCYSGAAECMVTGDQICVDDDYADDYPSALNSADICRYSDGRYCECCDDFICDEDIYWVEGMPYCECCYEEQTCDDVFTGDRIVEDSFVSNVYFGIIDKDGKTKIDLDECFYSRYNDFSKGVARKKAIKVVEKGNDVYVLCENSADVERKFFLYREPDWNFCEDFDFS